MIKNNSVKRAISMKAKAKALGGLYASESHSVMFDFHQAPLSMVFSRQEYWSGLPPTSPGDLPDPRIKPSLPHCRQILYHLSHQGSPIRKTL